MIVTGDQWPIFLYRGYKYDPDDPWNGLLCSTLLVSVSLRFIMGLSWCWQGFFRHTNIYSRHPAPSIRSPRLHAPATLAFMGWHESPPRQSHTLLPKWATLWSICCSLMYAKSTAGPLCSLVLACLFESRHDHRLGKVLHHHSRLIRRRRRKAGSRSSHCVVELVRISLWLISLNSLLYICSQIFPSHSSGRRAVCKNSALARIKAMRRRQDASGGAGRCE